MKIYRLRISTEAVAGKFWRRPAREWWYEPIPYYQNYYNYLWSLSLYWLWFCLELTWEMDTS